MISIVYEDESILVLDKPAGTLVHPAPGHEHEPTLTEFFVRHCPAAKEVGSIERPGVVHRLDQDTSGVIVMAKTRSAYLSLRRQFEQHKDVKKTYLAVCHNAPSPRSGTISTPIGRPPQPAISHYQVLGKNNGLSIIEFRIDTGRMHQIRIHAADDLGCPIVGDKTYGDAKKDARLHNRPSRQLLHAVELSFLHPETGKRVTFSSPPPDEIVYAG